MNILIKDIPFNLNKKITLKGWVFNFRSSGSIYFLLLRDGSGRIQAVVSKNEVSDKVWTACQKITLETSVEILGRAYKDKRSPYLYELAVEDLKIIHKAQKYPIGKKKHGIAFLMDHRHLWIRSPRQEAILKIRDEVIWILRQFFKEKDFILTDTPILTPTAAEGTTTLFPTDYFGEKAYLAQTGQLYLEALAMALGRVYDFGPTFRAEKSKTRRHLTEFWMLDAEAAFFDFEDNLKLQEEMITFLIKNILKTKSKELEFLGRDLKKLKEIKPPFPRLTYTEAIKFLQKKKFNIKWGEDLGADEEDVICRQFSKPVFITHYPASIKAFYMQPDPRDEKVVLNADLLAPEGYGEIIGGSERIWDEKLLENKIKEFNLPLKEYQWYLDLRRYGSCPHSGFGLGLERTIAWLCGLDHIREAIPFPRLLNRLRP